MGKLLSKRFQKLLGPIEELSKLRRPSRYGLRFFVVGVFGCWFLCLSIVVFGVVFMVFCLVSVFPLAESFKNFSESYPTFGSFGKVRTFWEAALVEVLFGRPHGLYINTLNSNRYQAIDTFS